MTALEADEEDTILDAILFREVVEACFSCRKEDMMEFDLMSAIAMSSEKECNPK